MKKIWCVGFLILVGFVSYSKSMIPPPPGKSDLKVEIKVTINKFKNVYVIEAKVSNLGPSHSTAEGRQFDLIATRSNSVKQMTMVAVLKREYLPPINVAGATIGKNNKPYFFSFQKNFPYQKTRTIN